MEENTAADAVELSAAQLDTLNNLTPAAGEHHMRAVRAGRSSGCFAASPRPGRRSTRSSVRPSELPDKPWKSGPTHVAYRYMADKHWFAHQGLWRQRVLDELLKAARHYEAYIDEAMRTATMPR